MDRSFLLPRLWAAGVLAANLWRATLPLMYGASALAYGVSALAAAAAPRDDVAGVVTSQAITVAGREFSDHFIAAWRDRPDSEHYALAIHERPSARSGSVVWIEFAHRNVFRAQLPPARAALKDRARQAADATWQAVQEVDGQRGLAADADLARDEF